MSPPQHICKDRVKRDRARRVIPNIHSYNHKHHRQLPPIPYNILQSGKSKYLLLYFKERPKSDYSTNHNLHVPNKKYTNHPLTNSLVLIVLPSNSLVPHVPPTNPTNFSVRLTKTERPYNSGWNASCRWVEVSSDWSKCPIYHLPYTFFIHSQYN